MTDYLAASDVPAVIHSARLAELLDDSVLSESEVTALIITWVNGTINSYLGRETLPITDALALAAIKPHAITLFKWKCADRHELRSGGDNEFRTDYEATIRWLEKIGAGTLYLPKAPVSQTTPTDDGGSTGGVSWGSETPIYGPRGRQRLWPY